MKKNGRMVQIKTGILILEQGMMIFEAKMAAVPKTGK
jgi:hypothetical protein